MPVMEIREDVFCTITAGEDGGSFEAINGEDLWKWNGTPFPTSGFVLTAKKSGSVGSATYVLPDYPFLSSKQVPTPQFGGTIFAFKKNGTQAGWLEVKAVGGDATLMWWSNGYALQNGRIQISTGDTLAFAQSSSLPQTPQYPLQDIQTSDPTPDK